MGEYQVSEQEMQEIEDTLYPAKVTRINMMMEGSRGRKRNGGRKVSKLPAAGRAPRGTQGGRDRAWWISPVRA